MLDGLLGRGFASKCKSFIKTTKNRIDVNRRKKNATLKFLKKDVADLLANGLDINAYGRAEGLLDELRGIWCYDFIEQCCDFLLKHLSIMEKIRHCPEDCREAVSSLMSAAARFSELPELRDLRDTFYERYGNSVELFVNQEFMENSSSKFFTKEKKVQLMQDIASEFSIKWDRKACEQIMSKTPAFVKDQPKTYGPSHMDGDKYKSTFGKQTVLKGDEHGVLPTERFRPDHGGYQTFHRAETNVRERNELSHQPRHGGLINGYKPFNIKEESNLKKDIVFPGTDEANLNKYGPGKEDSPLKVVRSGTSSQRAKESYSGGSKMQNRVDTVRIRDGRDGSSYGKPDISHHRAGLAGDYIRQNKLADAMRDVQEVHEPKPYRNNGSIPPPYTKSNVEPTGSKHAPSLASPRTTSDYYNVVPTAPSFQNRTKAGNRSERVEEEGDHTDHNRKGIESTRENGIGNETRNYYEQDGIGNSIPRPRYTRRKHSKSRSSNDDACNLEDVGVVKRRSRSRRSNDPKKGLQILVDDDHYEDEEERMIDKLLLHYSKKPAVEEPGMVRRKSKSRNAHHQGSDGHDETSGKVFPPRSVSLPRDQATPSESTKNFTRAASFQPDRSPARHVHPKLPDYDDLAARFAALKGR